MKRTPNLPINKGQTPNLRRSVRIAAKGPSPKQSDSKPKTRSLSKPTRKRKPLVKEPKPLSTSALEALNRETIDEPLPESIRPYRPDPPPPVSENPPSDIEMSTYDKNLPEELTRRRVYDELLPPDPKNPKTLFPEDPKNWSTIQDAIHAVDSSSTKVVQPSEQELNEYIQICKITAGVGINEEHVGKGSFFPYFGIGPEAEENHAFGTKQRWVDFPEPKIQQKPCPDHFEGLSSIVLPEWVEKHLGNYARPVAGIAFPNFLAELKAEGSMRIAHTQCRLDGACAARGYYELYRLFGDPDHVVLNLALVGTIEFNGEICVGNVHWMNKSLSGHEEVGYYMKRAFCFFTRGLSADDFVKGRRAARNFRTYFTKLRAEHLKRLRDLKPRPTPPDYKKCKKEDLIDKLKEQKDDGVKKAEDWESLVETVSSSEGPGSASQGHSSRARKHVRKRDRTDELPSASARKRTRNAATTN